MDKVLKFRSEISPEFEAYVEGLRPIIAWFTIEFMQVLARSYEKFGETQQIDMVNAIALSFRELYNDLIETLIDDVTETPDERSDLN